MIDSLYSEPITETDMQQFCVEMMKRLDIQRRQEHFCDVILEVGSGDDQARLKAHRNVLCAASPFFYNALNSDMKEKKEGVIRFEETSKAVMEAVLEFLYTGHVEVTQLNALDLLKIADFLIIPGLKEASSKFLSRTLSSSNSLMMYYSAVRYQCPELERQAREFVFANFMSVTECKEFLNLNVTQVEEWISSDEIRVKGEDEVFEVIVKWMKGKERERFFELFRHVRLVYLSRNYVFNDILPHPLVKDGETCTTFVLDVMKEASNGLEECYFTQPPRHCLKTSEDCLVTSGNKETFCYLPSENKWYQLEDMLSKKRVPYQMSASHGKLYISREADSSHCTLERYDPLANSWTALNSYNGKSPAVVNFQGLLYVIGGKNNKNEPINSVHKYNPDTNLWQEVAPLSIARCDACAVADNDSLYAIGGWSLNGVLDVVERFDPKTNSWCRVASTLERKRNSCGVIVRGKVFVFGGFTSRPTDHRRVPISSCSGLIEMYDPTSNMWNSIIQSMAAPKYAFSAVRFKGSVFVIGVWEQDSRLACLLKTYDVDKNEWKLCASIPRGLQLPSLSPLRIPRDILNTCEVVT